MQWAYAIAPKAHIVLLATPPAETQGVQGLPNLMKAIDWAIATLPGGHGVLDVVRHQRGGVRVAGRGEARSSPGSTRPSSAGQAKGDTFFASSGDDGSVGVTRAHHQTATVDHPSVSYPNVSPVRHLGRRHPGAVRLDLEPDVRTCRSTPTAAATRATGRGPRAAAPRPSGTRPGRPIGTGGGLSTVYGRPAYQDAVAGVVGNHRGVPDLAWNAAVNGGVLVYHSYFPEIDGTPRWGVFGGTSASSPQVAALTAIANQSRATAHKAGIGDLNQAIYSAGFANATAFSDIWPTPTAPPRAACCRTTGSGTSGPTDPSTRARCPATRRPTGYDLTTGWGSPKAPGYIAGLTAAP